MLNPIKPKIVDYFHNSITAWVVLSVSLILTIAAWNISNTYIESRSKDKFNFEVEKTSQAIYKRMEAYEQVLRGGVGLFNASEFVSRSDWKSYVSTLLIDTYWPGIQGIGYAQMFSAEELDAHENKIRQQGFPDYLVTPAGSREQYSAIIYLEPFSSRNLRAFGYDMYSNPIRREAMQRAAQEGQPALSGRVTLVQETNKDIQAGFLVYLPLYHTNMSLITPDERLAALRGFVYSPFRAKDLFHGMLNIKNQLIDYKIFDGDSTEAEQLLYDSTQDKAFKNDQPPLFTITKSLHLQGRDWTAQFIGYKELNNKLDIVQPSYVAVLGLMVDILLFLVILSLSKNRKSVLAHSQKMSLMTKELAITEQRLKHTHAIAKIGSWHLNIITNELTWSDETYKMFNLLPGSPMDYSRFISLIHPDDIERVKKAWQDALAGVPYDIEHKILAVNELRWVHEKAEIIYDVNSEPIEANGSVQDITERKKTEHELYLAKRVFSNAREGIIITDTEANIVDVNPMFSEITGFSHKELVGRNPSILSSGEHSNDEFKAMWEALNNTDFWQGDFWNKTKSGRRFLARNIISTVRDSKTNKVLNYVGLLSDVTEDLKQQEKMEHLAHHDSLTNLPNRYTFMEQLNKAIAHAKRQKNMVALAFIDLDDFKPINDQYGHDVGDKVLINVGEKLNFNLREEDCIARLGGDEFAMMITEQQSVNEIQLFMERILDKLTEPYFVDNIEIEISASIGVALYPNHATTAEQLLRIADQAMYKAKTSGRNQVSMNHS
jgi:diguanylate cyclase (GGDEF)-like protein/PAS domain S-box-containing protein